MVTQYAWPANSDFIMAIVHGIKYLFVQYTNREIHSPPPSIPFVCVEIPISNMINQKHLAKSFGEQKQ